MKNPIDMKKEIVAIDVEAPVDEKTGVYETSGVAFYRIDPEFLEFIEKCNDEHRIIGFEFEHGSLNFGVILGKKSD